MIKSNFSDIGYNFVSLIIFSKNSLKLNLKQNNNKPGTLKIIFDNKFTCFNI